MAQDISKKTLVILVFIIILVTIIGTWAVLNTSTQQLVRSSGQAKGIVMFQIVGAEPQAPQQSASEITGNAVFQIVG
ncbi:hypothetical protein HY493_05030 [Candidatus Woesearchaeota archaeon]|nr:hypothetical protein [Candidatus Woesearchaeota archaeon]